MLIEGVLRNPEGGVPGQSPVLAHRQNQEVINKAPIPNTPEDLDDASILPYLPNAQRPQHNWGRGGVTCNSITIPHLTA